MEESGYIRAFTENALEIAIFFDASGRIIYMNPAAVSELEQQDWKQLSIHDIFPVEFSKDILITQIVDSFPEELSVLTAYRKNRTCFPMKGRVIRNAYLPATFICVGFDETDRNFYEKRANRADEEAKEANKVKTEFVATITHELRTPLNGILANTQDLLGKEVDDEKRYILQMMERGCRDMGELINNILDFSKLEAGKFILEKREFDFRGMIDYVKANHQKKITEKGLDFFVSISPEVPEKVVGDELRIVQILNNIISNATKFTDVGKVSVEILKTAQTGKRIELFFLIVDTGIGISLEQQDKLFKSFSQVDASISRRFGGTGLGLTISKQLVELMDGKINVESELHKGSIFSFSIWVDTVLEEENNLISSQAPQEVVYAPLRIEPKISEETAPIWIFGSPENRREILQKADKLILSVEFGSYEKAEVFASALKKLCDTAPPDIRQATLKLKMAVQKADYEKIEAAYEDWSELYGRTEE